MQLGIEKVLSIGELPNLFKHQKKSATNLFLTRQCATSHDDSVPAIKRNILTSPTHELGCLIILSAAYMYPERARLVKPCRPLYDTTRRFDFGGSNKSRARRASRRLLGGGGRRGRCDLVLQSHHPGLPCRSADQRLEP